MDQIKKRALNIILFVLLIVMAFVIFTLNNKLLVMQSSVNKLLKTASHKQEKLDSIKAKFQEQNRTLQTLQSEKVKAEAYIKQLSKELEGARTPFVVPRKKSNESNHSRGIRG